ncbi:MAG: TonB-dependent receptor, partial [Bacteroidota bacterium]
MSEGDTYPKLFPYLIAILFCVAITPLKAQKVVIITGQVTDFFTGENIIGANVVIDGTTTGAATDVNGRFKFSFQEGSYTIKTSAIGYEDNLLENALLSSSGNTIIDIRLKPNVTELEGVTIEAEGDRTNSNVLLLSRKKAVFAVENIGAQALAEKGVTNVESGLTKISGISKASRGLFIRGLGDRYNNAYLNTLPLPSANPDKKVFELDLLPVTIVENIDVSKVYTVDRFADVSGASIAIHTRDPLAPDFIRIGLGFGINTQSTFKPFRSSRDGDVYYLGISGSGRQSPVDVGGSDFILAFPASESQPFRTGFDVATIQAPLDHRWTIDFGKTWQLKKAQLGIIFSGSNKNSYRSDQGMNDVLDAGQSPTTAFTRSRSRFETNVTSLLGIRYKQNEKYDINLRYLLVNNSENNVIVSQGQTIDFENLRRIRNRYLEKRLSVFQATINQTFLDDKLLLQWGGSTAGAFTDEPDRRDLTFFADPGSEVGTINRNVAAENGRYFQEIDERENNLFAELGYHFGKKSENTQPHQWVVGYQFKEKARELDFRTFTLVTTELNTEGIDLQRLDALFSDENFRSGLFSYRDTNGGERQSRALRKLSAAYSYLKITPFEHFEVVPGLRAEATNQTVFFRLLGTPLQNAFQTVPLDRVDILPSLNTRYKLSKDRYIRGGIARTLTRPNFNELVPAPQVNENLQSVVGRPTLENSLITNVDLKYERYPNPGELIALGVFYKHIDKPIEQVRSGENFISFFNVTEAKAYGLEIEIRKRLGTMFSPPLFDDFVVDGNISLLATEVNTNPDNITDIETQELLSNVTNGSRQLQGAAPFIVNVSLAYDRPIFESSEVSVFSLTYNHAGKRMINVGTQQRGDEFELAYGTLDFTGKNEFSNGWAVGFSVRNLLNPAIRRA